MVNRRKLLNCTRIYRWNLIRCFTFYSSMPVAKMSRRVRFKWEDRLCNDCHRSIAMIRKLVNAAINMLMKFRDVMEAEHLFESLKNRSLISYGAMMQGYIDNQMSEKALDLFEKIPFALDDVSYTIVFSACAALNNAKAVQFGNRILHSIPATFKNDSTVLGSILRMLMKFRQIEDAESLFSSSKKNTPVLLGIMMQGFVDNGMPGKALDLFETSSIPPNEIISIILYSACAALNDERAVQLGNKLLRQMPIKYRENGVLIGSALNMLMKFGQTKKAEDLFSQVTRPTANLYGILMHGYNHNERPDKSMDLFEKLQGKELTLDDQIYLAWINSAAQIALSQISQKVADRLPLAYRQKSRMQSALINMWVCRTRFPFSWWIFFLHILRVDLRWWMKQRKCSTRYLNRIF